MFERARIGELSENAQRLQTHSAPRAENIISLQNPQERLHAFFDPATAHQRGCHVDDFWIMVVEDFIEQRRGEIRFELKETFERFEFETKVGMTGELAELRQR